MKNKIIIIIAIVMILFVLLFINRDKIFKSNNTSLSDNTDINTDDGDENIDWSNYDNENIILSKSIKITKGGTYNLSGTIDDGFITVDTSDDVKLIFNNVNITNSNGPAIYIEKSNNTVIYLTDGTINTLEDGVKYTSFDEDVNGVIYSKDDLIFDGLGMLKIKSNYGDGIVSKDDLKIINGKYEIESTDDGIRGKDSVYIIDGEFNIVSNGDGIKSSNDTDADKGFVKIENGSFKIVSELDGIQAERTILIENGNFDIKTGNGNTNSSSSSNWGYWGKNPNNYGSSVNNESAKGLKAGTSIVINNGEFSFDTSDDSIHSNDSVSINGGTIKILSGDDGIHADKELVINDGNIDIQKSYEGLEAAKMTINNGTINVTSSDDGINVAGGNDGSAMGRPGQNNFSNSSDNVLTINGGNIHVSASGDGIDVNGSGYIYGGNITVDGPTDSGNGALDYDGEFIVNGGVVVAAGASGMAQDISDNSKQYNVSLYFNSNLSNSKIDILDSNGNTIVTYNGSKSFSSLIMSSDKFNKGTYTVMINDKEYTTFTISSITTRVGNSMSVGGGMQHGGMGNRPGRW